MYIFCLIKKIIENDEWALAVEIGLKRHCNNNLNSGNYVMYVPHLWLLNGAKFSFPTHPPKKILCLNFVICQDQSCNSGKNCERDLALLNRICT